VDIAAVKTIDLPRQTSAIGELVVLQASDGAVPFSIARVFTVRAGSNVQRGRHAHKRCNQLMVCTYGRCEVTCSDGLSRQTFLLDGMNQGLLVPCGIWAEQRYLDDDNVLMVLCDRPYEEHDYVRDYQDFLAFRKQSTSSQ
jgi:dTDP-4-dehydrorhamnose 3,5-epimerase-like enzyme